ncbi:uncharacterized protein LOC124795044 [Schistocerca piceifrons]|uniref:uncharacterized protein LOC124795044 n=1 Tax=Schistocerca piceifrons TaxID=274613 RepID=UPI001F5FC780|nr:uncharacterized protein LOC124795044 [Schistocerca piceifrons]
MEKNMDKEIQLAVHDLKAVLLVPTGQTAAFFYKSRHDSFTVWWCNIYDWRKGRSLVRTASGDFPHNTTILLLEPKICHVGYTIENAAITNSTTSLFLQQCRQHLSSAHEFHMQNC